MLADDASSQPPAHAQARWQESSAGMAVLGDSIPVDRDLSRPGNDDKADWFRLADGSYQPAVFVPYCRTCTFSRVTSPLVIMPSSSGRKASIFSSLSTISITSGRSSERRRIFVV